MKFREIWVVKVHTSGENTLAWFFSTDSGVELGEMEKITEIRTGSLSRLAASLYRQPAHRLGESGGIGLNLK